MEEKLIHPFDLVSGALARDRAAFTEDSAMYRDHGWDSFGHLEVVLAIERHYGVTIDEQSVEHYTSMRAILELYEHRRRMAEEVS